MGRVRRKPPNAIPPKSASVSGGMGRDTVPVERLPDEMLLAGLALGDPEISVAFVRRFQRLVFATALTVVGDMQLAEDIAQQTFERAWRHAQVFDSRRGSVRTWLRTIAHNLAIDTARAQRFVPVATGDLLTMIRGMTAGPEPETVAGETTTVLRRALAVLPPEQARALVLAGIYGMTAREIAEFEQIPLGTAKTRIRTAMHKLRDSLELPRADHD